MSAARHLAPPWKPGQSGNPGGRRKRVFPHVDELLKKAGKEPIAEILALLPKLRDREQAQVWLELLPYVHAKARPDEHQEDDLDKMSTAELVQLIKDKLPEVG